MNSSEKIAEIWNNIYNMGLAFHLWMIKHASNIYHRSPNKWNVGRCQGSTEIRTRIAGFKVQSAGHYTIEPHVCVMLKVVFDISALKRLPRKPVFRNFHALQKVTIYWEQCYEVKCNY